MRALILASALALAGEAAAYEEVFYRSGELRIQAYLYVPGGRGPFPVVIYNHGSRNDRERESVPFEHIGAMLTRAGYLVFVPERRGYGKSDGQVWWQETGNNPARLVGRLQAETDDVLAAAEYLRTVPAADTTRMAVMGWSFGGIVSMLVASRSNAFRAVINQAGGALTWHANAHVRDAIGAAAEKITKPTLLMVSRNDRTTQSIVVPAEIFKARGITHRAILYDDFKPQGHAIFSARGVHLWERDVLEFLEVHLRS